MYDSYVTILGNKSLYEAVLCKLISLGMPKIIRWLSVIALGKEMLGNNMHNVTCEPVHGYKLTTWSRAF